MHGIWLRRDWIAAPSPRREAAPRIIHIRNGGDRRPKPYIAAVRHSGAWPLPILHRQLDPAARTDKNQARQGVRCRRAGHKRRHRVVEHLAAALRVSRSYQTTESRRHGAREARRARQRCQTSFSVVDRVRHGARQAEAARFAVTASDGELRSGRCELPALWLQKAGLSCVWRWLCARGTIVDTLLTIKRYRARPAGIMSHSRWRYETGSSRRRRDLAAL